MDNIWEGSKWLKLGSIKGVLEGGGGHIGKMRMKTIELQIGIQEKWNDIKKYHPALKNLVRNSERTFIYDSGRGNHTCNYPPNDRAYDAVLDMLFKNNGGRYNVLVEDKDALKILRHCQPHYKALERDGYGTIFNFWYGACAGNMKKRLKELENQQQSVVEYQVKPATHPIDLNITGQTVTINLSQCVCQSHEKWNHRLDDLM